MFNFKLRLKICTINYKIKMKWQAVPGVRNGKMEATNISNNYSSSSSSTGSEICTLMAALATSCIICPCIRDVEEPPTRSR